MMSSQREGKRVSPFLGGGGGGTETELRGEREKATVDELITPSSQAWKREGYALAMRDWLPS